MHKDAFSIKNVLFLWIRTTLDLSVLNSEDLIPSRVSGGVLLQLRTKSEGNVCDITSGSERAVIQRLSYFCLHSMSFLM